MARVIKIEPSSEVAKQIVCRGCGATIEYVPNEVQSRSGTDYGGGPDGVEWVNCPNCGKQITIRSW